LLGGSKPVLTTTSAIVSFYEYQTEKATQFYRQLAKSISDLKYREVFQSFASENEQHRKLIVRAYREVITDAIEAGFAFSGLHQLDYVVNLDLDEDASIVTQLQQAIELEDRAFTFCNHVSERSRTLLADISYAFENIAKRKAARLRTLHTLLDQQSCS
jgi:rubrerythrin